MRSKMKRTIVFLFSLLLVVSMLTPSMALAAGNATVLLYENFALYDNYSIGLAVDAAANSWNYVSINGLTNTRFFLQKASYEQTLDFVNIYVHAVSLGTTLYAGSWDGVKNIVINTDDYNNISNMTYAQSVAAHEFGHAFYLPDDVGTESIMAQGRNKYQIYMPQYRDLHLLVKNTYPKMATFGESFLAEKTSNSPSYTIRETSSYAQLVEQAPALVSAKVVDAGVPIITAESDLLKATSIAYTLEVDEWIKGEGKQVIQLLIPYSFEWKASGQVDLLPAFTTLSSGMQIVAALNESPYSPNSFEPYAAVSIFERDLQESNLRICENLAQQAYAFNAGSLLGIDV